MHILNCLWNSFIYTSYFQTPWHKTVLHQSCVCFSYVTTPHEVFWCYFVKSLFSHTWATFVCGCKEALPPALASERDLRKTIVAFWMLRKFRKREYFSLYSKKYLLESIERFGIIFSDTLARSHSEFYGCGSFLKPCTCPAQAACRFRCSLRVPWHTNAQTHHNKHCWPCQRAASITPVCKGDFYVMGKPPCAQGCEEGVSEIIPE